MPSWFSGIPDSWMPERVPKWPSIRRWRQGTSILLTRVTVEGWAYLGGRRRDDQAKRAFSAKWKSLKVEIDGPRSWEPPLTGFRRVPLKIWVNQSPVGTTRLSRIALGICIAITSTLLAFAPAIAEWRPTQPITFLVMAGKGGGADKAVRLMAESMHSQGLVSVPIEPVNMPGGSGADAMVELQRRAGDDHVIMFTLNSFYTTPMRRPELGLDINNYTPIARMAEDTFVLWVNAERADINSIGDFVTAARAKGSGWVMAGTGEGSEDNLLTDFMNVTFGLNMTYKPVKSGGLGAKDLVSNAVDSTVNNPSEQHEYFEQGLTKPVVMFTPQRMDNFITSPTLRETGVDFHYYMQRSVVGAPNMSAEAQSFYQNLFQTYFNGSEWQQYRKDNGLRGDFLTGVELREYWNKEVEKHERWQMAIEMLKP